LALSKSYLSNLGKSLYYSAKEVVKNQMPILTGTYENNKEIFSSGIEYTRRFVASKGASSTHSLSNMASQFLKDLDELKKNAFEDLRSGKLNNLDRQMEELEKQFGGGFDSDHDFSFTDAEISFEEDENSISIKNSQISEKNSNMRTKALMETIIDSSEKTANYIVGNNRKLNSMFMTLSAQMHTETIKMMSDTNKLLTSIVEFQNNQIIDHMNKTLTFYDNVLQELREIKQGLIPKPEETKNRPITFDDILTSSGLNLRAYGELIKKNFSNWFGGTTLGLAFSMSKMAGDQGVFGAIKSNPIGTVLQLMMSGLLPKSVKTAMTKLDNSLAGLFSAMILRLNNMKNDFYSPFRDMIGSVLGIDVPGKRSIDTSKFHKDMMQYNGRADKAITEVIPTLLSHILSAIQGSNKVMLYNYSSGKFVEKASVSSEHDSRIRRSALFDMYDLRYALKNRLAQVQGGTSEFMMDELDTFLEYIANAGKFYNPYQTKSANDLSGLKLRDSRSYNLIRAAFMSLPKSMQNRIATEIIRGRMGSRKVIENIEEELKESGLGIAYSGLQSPSIRVNTSYSISNKLLRDIKNILIEGIKVVQIGYTPAAPTVIKRIMGRKLDRTNYNVTTGTSTSQPSVATSSPTPQGKSELEQAFQKSEQQLLREMAMGADLSYSPSRAGFKNFVERVTSEKSLRNKFRVIRESVSPGNIISKGINKLDEFIHTILFGSHGRESSDDEDGDGDGGPASRSFFSRMTQRISNAIDKSVKWVERRILTPLHEKFFGENGIFTKFQERFTPFVEKFKDLARSKFEKFKEFFMGSLNKEGFYTGGIFADIANMFKDQSNQIRHFFTGAGYTKSTGEVVPENKDTSVFAYVKKYTKNIMENIKTGLFGTKYEVDEVDPETGEVRKVTRRKKDGILSAVMDQLKRTYQIFDNLFKSKKDESEEDVQKNIEQWKRELKGFLPKGLAGGALGAVSSAILPGGPVMWGILGSTVAFASHSKKFREFLFGNDEEGRPGIIPAHYKKILNEIKQSLPSIMGGGIVGLGASLILPGGPLLGLTLGSAIGFAASSKRMQEWLFGKTDENGNIITKGILGPEFKERIKEVAPAMGAGGILGMGASIFLPGGPLLGLTIGSALGFASKSKKVQELLFGKTDADGNIITKGLISPAMREKINEMLPKGMAGAVFGALSGLVKGSFLPGGPLVGAMVGASLSILATSDKFKEFMFGKVDPESGKRVGGLLGNVRDFVRDEFLIPFKGWVKKKGKVVGEWFDEAIKAPLMSAMQPLKAAFGVIGKNIKDAWTDLKKSFVNAFHEVFTKNVGIPLKNFIKENITDPLKRTLDKFFNFLGRGLSMILTAPIKGLTLFAKSIIDSEAEKTGMSSDEIIQKYGGEKDEPSATGVKTSTMVSKTKEIISKASIAGLLPGPQIAGYLPPAMPHPMHGDNIGYMLRINTSAGTGAPNSAVAQAFAEGQSKNVESINQENAGIPNGYYRTMLDYVKDIRDEVHGQLDGVGYNVETIANILLDQFGHPSVFAKGIKGVRGNLKRRGFMGRLMGLLKSPFKLAKNIIVKPVQLVLNTIKNTLMKIPRMVGRAISWAGRSVGKIISMTSKSLSGAVKLFGKSVKGVTKMLRSIGKFATTLLDTIIVKPTKALFRASKGVIRGFGTIAKGFGVLLKDTASSIFNLARKAIPALSKGIFSLTKGMINLTKTVGNAVVGMAKFAMGLLGKGFRAAGRLFGVGRSGKMAGNFTGLSGNPVYVVGGTLDLVDRVRVVEKIGAADDYSTSGLSFRRWMNNRGGVASSATHSQDVDTLESGTSGRGRFAAFKQKTFKAVSMFAKAGSYVARMARSKWNDTIPRIAFIETMAKNVKTEKDYHYTTLGLLHELVVSNIQILEATNKSISEEKGSIFDTIKSIAETLKNAWPLLAAALSPLLSGILGALGSLGNLLRKLGGRIFGRGGSARTTSGGATRPPAGGTTFVDIDRTARTGGGPKTLPPIGTYIPLPSGGRGGTTVALPPGPYIPLPNGRGGTILSLPGDVIDPGPVRRTTTTTGPMRPRTYIDVIPDKNGVYHVKPSKWVTAARRIPIAGALLGAGIIGYDAYNIFTAGSEEEKYEAKRNLFGTLGSMAGGAAAGAGLGALLGSFAPGIGNVIGGTIGGIGGAIIGEAGVRKIYEKKDDIGQWAKDKYNQIKNFTTDTVGKFWNSAPIETARNLATGFVTMISEIVSGVYDATVDVLKSTGRLFGRMWSSFKESAKEKWNDYVVEPYNEFMGWIKKSLKSIKETVSEKWNEYVKEPIREFKIAISEKWKDMKEWIKDSWDRYIPEPLKNFLNTVKTKFNETKELVSEKWNDWVVQPLKNLGNKIKDLIDRAKDWVKNIWNSIWGDRGESAKESMEEAGKKTGEKARKIGSGISSWIDSLWNKEKGGGDPAYDLSYVLKGAVPGTDATAQDLPMIASIANRFGINPHLWIALAETESNLYSKATNPKSTARGWGQILEGTARDIYENKLRLGRYNHNMAFDKNINATLSMAYLRQMFDTFGGDATKAIIAYNVGPGNVKKGIGLHDTGGYGAGHGIEYLQRVIRNLKENTGLDLKDVVDASKMTPIDYATIGALSGLSAYDAASSGSAKEYTMSSMLSSLGAYLSGDKLREVYGFDPSELLSNLDKELLKKTDPFYASVTGTGLGTAGATYYAASKTYSNSDINAVKARNSKLYPFVSGDNDIHEFFAERLNNLAKAYGKPLSINSGYRSDQEQMRLINEWRAKNPGKSEEERRKWVADPGRSNHAVGIAADISGWIQSLPDSELEKFGLYRPMSWEPWHFEPIETKIYGRTRNELMPLFGTPVEPNPNLSNYISSQFKGTNSTGFMPNISYAYNAAYQMGGGDPVYDRNFGPPDISGYTTKVKDAVSIASDKSKDNLSKIVEILAQILIAIESLVDISDESKSILKEYFKNIMESSENSRPRTSSPIINNPNTPPANPLIDAGTSTRKRNDKSKIIAQIARGTMF